MKQVRDSLLPLVLFTHVSLTVVLRACPQSAPESGLVALCVVGACKPSWGHELQPHTNTCSSGPRRPLQGRTKKLHCPKNRSSLRPLYLCSS